MTSVRERLVRFGEGENLFGVVTPPSGPANNAAPFVIVLNAGVVHRVGPFGMSVGLARHLSSRGFSVLRLDQAGLGDSAPWPGTLSKEERIVRDGQAALDMLRSRFGARRFVVVGLCSGALAAHRIALETELAGVCLLDGYAYPTRSFYLDAAARRFKHEGGMALAHSLLQRTKVALGLSPPSSRGRAREQDDRTALMESFFDDWPPREQAQAELEQILAKGTRALFQYTGGWSDFVDARQFDEMFPKLAHRERVEIRYLPHVDHTYLLLAHRALLFRSLEKFVAGLTRADA